MRLADLLLLLAAYSQDATGDINGDGATNVEDLLLLLAGYGSGCGLRSLATRSNFPEMLFFLMTELPTTATPAATASSAAAVGCEPAAC